MIKYFINKERIMNCLINNGFTLMENKEAILSLLNLDYQSIQELESYKTSICEKDKKILFKIKLKKIKHTCPNCFITTDVIHDYRKRILKTYSNSDKEVLLEYSQRRYLCKHCGKKFIENNNIVNKFSKLTIQLINKIHKDLTISTDVKRIALNNNVSSATINRLLDKFHKNVSLPSVLSLDEIKFRKRLPKYSLVIYDNNKKELNNLVDDRRYNSIKNYFSSFSLEERLKVKIVSIDLWDTYYNISKELFPNADIVADKFHYTRHITWALRNIRIREMNKEKFNSITYKILKKNWRLIETKPTHLNGYCFNILRNTITSKIDFINDIKVISKDLDEAIGLYHFYFNNSYQMSSKEQAETFIDTWLDKLKNSNLVEFNNLYTTFNNWKTEIINSLILKDNDGKPYTNGRIEGFNNKIKLLNRIGYGYRNIKRFTTRLLLLN